MTVLLGALLATTLTAALAAGPARAQAPVVVAGPPAGGAAVSAFDRAAGLCLQVSGPAFAGPLARGGG